MVKKGPLRSLSIVVDPSHRQIADETDKVPRGRIVLDGTSNNKDNSNPSTRKPTRLVPPSPAPSSTFNVPSLPPLNTTSLKVPERLSLAPQEAVEPTQPTAATAKAFLDTPDPSAASSSAPRRPSGFRLPPAISVVTSSPDFNSSDNASPAVTRPGSPNEARPLPRTSSFSESLARRSSVPTIPSLPSGPLGSGSLGYRSRHDSISSRSSSQSLPRKRSGGGRAEEDGFSYLQPSASTSALSQISVPAPYQNGAIQIIPGIWLGCEENAKDWDGLRRCNIGSILNVAKEIPDEILGPAPGGPAASGSKPTPLYYPADPTISRPEMHYLHLPWSHGQPDLVKNGFPQAMAFADDSIRRGKGVLVHCQCGVSRSATLVIAMVMRAASQPDATEDLKKIGTSMNGAYEFVKEKSICIGPNMSLIYQLLEYEKKLQSKGSSHRRQHSLSESEGLDSSGQQSDLSPHDSETQHLSEEERIRAEEEEWARMRRQLEEEEERERQESLRAAAAASGGPGRPGFIQIDPKPAVETLTVPWNDGWRGFGSRSNRARTPSVADDEEARDLDRAMEERLVRRRGSAASVASSSGLGPGHASTNLSTGAAGSSQGGNGSATGPAAPSWKARLGNKRVRAGSVESNVTGRSISMLSVEEEDEGEDEQNRAFPTSGNPSMGWKGHRSSRSRVHSISSSAAGSERTDSIASTSDFESPVVGNDEDDDKMDGVVQELEVKLPNTIPAPPLSATANSVTASTTSPVTPLSIHPGSGPTPSTAKPPIRPFISILPSERGGEDSGVEILVEEPTPLTNRHLPMLGGFQSLDSPISPVGGFNTGKRLSFSKRPGTLAHLRGSAFDPPPSASPFKSSFGFGGGSSEPIPPPSASHFKTSFGSVNLPPPSASHAKTSFGNIPLPPPSSSARKTAFDSSELSVPFPRKGSKGSTGSSGSSRHSRKISSTSIAPSLAPVPSSPPVNPEPQSHIMDIVASSTNFVRRLSSSSSRSGNFRIGSLSRERSPSPPAIAVMNAEPEPPSLPTVVRKPTKSRPTPLSLSSFNVVYLLVGLLVVFRLFVVS